MPVSRWSTSSMPTVHWSMPIPFPRPIAGWTVSKRENGSSRISKSVNLLERVEPHTHSVPHAQRGDAIIEPWLTDQWYVDAETLAQPALAAVRDGRTRFVPERYANDYFRWLENIQPWCISRQLWWGHQIPAWYGPDGETFVAETEADAARLAEAHYGKAAELDPGRRRSGYLVLVRAMAVLDPWLA